MTTYNTGNPVPSLDPRDLLDNSQTLDEVVTGTELTATNRLGNQVRTLAGLEAAASAIADRVYNPTSITALAAIVPTHEGQTAHLVSVFTGWAVVVPYKPVGGGDFVASLEDLSAEVASDTAMGLLVPFSSDPTGASGAWVRDTSDYLRPEWFGAVPIESNDSTDAVNACVLQCLRRAYSMKLSGGCYSVDGIEVDTATYPWGLSIIGSGMPRGEEIVTPLSGRTVIKHNDGNASPLINQRWVGSDQNSGAIKISSLGLFCGDSSTHAMFLRGVTEGLDLSNIGIRVPANNLSAHGVELYDCWRFDVKNIFALHANTLGTATGMGLYINNISADALGGAINQGVVQNFHGRRFYDGIHISRISGTSEYINSLVFLGGASEFCNRYGVYIGNAVESIHFDGYHIENTGALSAESSPAQLYIDDGANNVKFENAKFHNSNYRAGLREVHIEDTAKSTNVNNVFFSGVCDVGVDIITGGSTQGNIDLDGLTFSPITDGVGVGISAVGNNRKSVRLGAVEWGHNGNAFATDIDGLDNVTDKLTGMRGERAFTASTTTLTPFFDNLICSNEGATGTVFLYLPDPANAKRLAFIKRADQTLAVDPNGLYPINGDLTSLRANDNTSSGRYSYLELTSIGGEWVITKQSGTWVRV